MNINTQRKINLKLNRIIMYAYTAVLAFLFLLKIFPKTPALAESPPS